MYNVNVNKESFVVEDIVGKKILIHGYKHNGKIHRCWSKGLVLQETDDHYIVINNRTLVRIRWQNVAYT